MGNKGATQFWARYRKLCSKDLPVLLKTGIPQSTLSSWRKGALFPRADEAVMIAKALGTTVEYLVYGNEKSAQTISPSAFDIGVTADAIDSEGFSALKTVAASLAVSHSKKKKKNKPL